MKIENGNDPHVLGQAFARYIIMVTFIQIIYLFDQENRVTLFLIMIVISIKSR